MTERNRAAPQGPPEGEPERSPWPALDVVMPVRNDAGSVERAVRSVLDQDYPGAVSLTMAVAPSVDGSEEVCGRLASDDERVSVVVNPAGSTPAGLNAAIAAGSAPVVARVDSHCELPVGYLRRAVETLESTGAVNVGGVQRAVGSEGFRWAAAYAMSSRFGVGDSSFHIGGSPGPTDTVYLGVFRRPALEAAGGFDERLLRNQDYELNWRLRDAGGTVWFDPELVVEYAPRGSVAALARQYFDYGRWKREVVGRHPRSIRWRQLVPPLTVVGVVTGLTLGRWWKPARAAPWVYLGAVVAATAPAVNKRGARGVEAALAFVTMHFAWGVGFLVGPPRGPTARRS